MRAISSQNIPPRLTHRILGVLLALSAVAGIGTAQVTPFKCASDALTANPVTLRSEGTSEQLSDIRLACTGGYPASAATITIYLNTGNHLPNLTVTSKVLNPATGATEALAISSTGASVQGTASGNVLTFSYIPVPSGVAPVTITITNIRVNAAQSLGQTSISAQSFLTGTNVDTNSFTNPVTVAYMAPGLSQQASVSGAFSACSSLTPSSGPQFSLNVSEGFATAFKTQGGAANSTLGSEFTANTETGYYESVSGISNQANSGTRVRAVFTNVPTGVAVYVPVSLTGSNQSATKPTLTLTASESGALGGITVATGNGLPASPALAQIAIAGGTGEAVYEVTAQDPLSIDSFTVPVYLSGATAAFAKAVNPITAVLNLAPTASGNIPNFVVANSVTVTAAATVVCGLTITSASTLSPPS